ncbi:hypothetical protein SBV42_03675 [Chlamydia crocodili]|uniref:Uncharacterized protein n=1 Tax=Chlamydia crocodili TaxID=2766982 RepID=A0ABX8CD74_9CHLA|nr:hypothetical protein [Chlamydia crocodili]QVE48862.1 hypothetical protein H9Q19_04045 [Chlamydia crocodili]
MKKIFYILCLCGLLPVATMFSIEEVQEEIEHPSSLPTVCPFYLIEEAN